MTSKPLPPGAQQLLLQTLGIVIQRHNELGRRLDDLRAVLDEQGVPIPEIPPLEPDEEW